MNPSNDFFNRLRNMLSRLPGWVDEKSMGLVLLVLIMLVAMSWSEPLPGQQRGAGKMSLAQVSATPRVQPTDTPAPQPSIEVPPDASPTPIPPTPIPEEWLTNREMGTGIVMGAVVLVLIIVGGTLGAIRRR